MKRYMLIALIALGALVLRPAEVHAESCGIFEIFCWSGATKIADRDAQRRENENALKVQGATQRAQIKADNDLRIAEADKILQAQIANGQITRDLARIQLDSFKAQLDNDTKIQQAVIFGASAQNVATIQGQTQIAVAAVQESGLTVREKMKIEIAQRFLDIVTLLPKILFVFLLFILTVKLLRRHPITSQTALTQAPVQPIVYDATQQGFDEYQKEFYPITAYKKDEMVKW